MEVKRIHNKGNHLLIDIYSCKSKENLNSKKKIKNFLLEATKKISMKPISKPFVLYYNSKNKRESGITGFIILAESHISIHTYPLKNFASIDIYSCNEFDYRSLIKFVKNNFKTNKVKTKLIKRPL